MAPSGVGWKAAQRLVGSGLVSCQGAVPPTSQPLLGMGIASEKLRRWVGREDESMTWLTVETVDPKKEEAEGEHWGRLKGKMQKIHFSILIYFPHLPKHTYIPEAWHRPSCCLGLVQT